MNSERTGDFKVHKGADNQPAPETRKEGRNDNAERKRIKALFWNVAELEKKDKETWEYLEKFDIINPTETWMEGKRWDKLKKSIPKGYR